MSPSIPKNMRAIEIAQPGAPDVLRATTRPVPDPTPGEVLIQVSAAGVNRPDVMQRLGMYPPPPGAPDIPGLEVAGTIVHVHLISQLAITFVEVQVAVIINVTKGWTFAPAFFTGDLVTCLGKDASAIVQIEVVAADVIGNEQILITIVVDISKTATEAPVGIVDTRSSRIFDKGTVSVIDEKFVWLTGRVTSIDNIEVNITIVVDI